MFHNRIMRAGQVPTVAAEEAVVKEGAGDAGDGVDRVATFGCETDADDVSDTLVVVGRDNAYYAAVVDEARPVVDVRSFLPLEIEHITETLRLAETQVLLLKRELGEAREALQIEFHRREELQRALESLESLAVEGEVRLRKETDEIVGLRAAIRVEKSARLKEADEMCGLRKDAQKFQKEIRRLQAVTSGLQEELTKEHSANEELSVSLRLAENRSRRLEFDLRNRDDAGTELRLLLQSCLHTMNKHAGNGKRARTGVTPGTSGKVKRLVEKVKASHMGIDVTNLSVEDVQAFISLVVRRMNASYASEVCVA